MMKFLCGQKIVSTVREILRDGDKADLAVAYWGNGAIEKLGLASRQAKVRVLCDLQSGCCNPSEMQKLLKRRGTEVRTIDRFHAKVYLTNNSAVIGSANASTRGLEENVDIELEAAVITNDAAVREDATNWFNRH